MSVAIDVWVYGERIGLKVHSTTPAAMLRPDDARKLVKALEAAAALIENSRIDVPPEEK